MNYILLNMLTWEFNTTGIFLQSVKAIKVTHFVMLAKMHCAVKLKDTMKTFGFKKKKKKNSVHDL